MQTYEEEERFPEQSYPDVFDCGAFAHLYAGLFPLPVTIWFQTFDYKDKRTP